MSSMRLKSELRQGGRSQLLNFTWKSRYAKRRYAKKNTLSRYINAPFLAGDLSLLPGPVDDISDPGLAKPGFFPDRGHSNAFSAPLHNLHHRLKYRLGLFLSRSGNQACPKASIYVEETNRRTRETLIINDASFFIWIFLGIVAQRCGIS